MTVEEIMTIDEAAKLLRIGRTHAYEMARLGTLPGCLRYGKTFRVLRSALLAGGQAEAGRPLAERVELMESDILEMGRALRSHAAAYEWKLRHPCGVEPILEGRTPAELIAEGWAEEPSR